MSNLEKELYKPVQKIHLSKLLPNNQFPPGFDHAVINEDGKILNFCSKRYKLEYNKDIFEPIEAEMKSMGLPFHKKINIINGSKFYVDYIIKDRRQTLSVNDILPKISIWNSYDGVIKKRIEMGFHKLICKNGLTAPSRKWQEIWRKHTDDEQSAQKFTRDIIKSINEFLVESKVEMGIFEDMNQKLIEESFLEEMAHNMKLPNKLIRIAQERFNLEVAGDLSYVNEHGETVTHDGSPKSIFTAYNALNYAIYNTNSKELPEKKLEKDRKLFSLMQKQLV